MPNLLQELQNNEAVLLMYLSGELPGEDHAEVEQMLAADASLRAELEEVRLAKAGSDAALGKLDRIARLPVKQDAAMRQVRRLMARWNVERLAKIPVPVPARSRRLPWWSYPIATAAAVLLAFLTYWGNKEEVISPDLRMVATESPFQGSPEIPSELSDEAEAFAMADQLVQSFDNGDRILDNAGSTISLAEAERQLFALATSSDEVFSLNVSDSSQ